jgi:hypothetical protein
MALIVARRRAEPLGIAAVATTALLLLGGLCSAGKAASPDAPVGEDGVIGADHRKLLSEFTIDGMADQDAMRASLAATQRLSCGASASLVYRKDVIIFSAHQLIDDHGKLSADFDHCFFVVTRKKAEDYAEERYPILLTTVDHGAFRPEIHQDDKGSADNQEDWAIARLARPVEGVEPYQLADPDEVASPGSEVTTVSDTTYNWKGVQGEAAMLAQNCHVIALEARLAERFPAVVHTDCDVGGGASGSAVLRDVGSGRPRYLATMVAYTGNHCLRPDITTCYSSARRVDADLAARIQGASAIRSTPEDRIFGDLQDGRLASKRNEVAAKAAAALSAAFPANEDQKGREVAELHARIEALVADGRAAETDSLFLEIFRVLRDPDQTRPEWPRLLLENGESMALQGRRPDAFYCFRAAYEAAPEALKPFLLIKLAQTASDAKIQRDYVRNAFLVGGEALFRLAGAEA